MSVPSGASALEPISVSVGYLPLLTDESCAPATRCAMSVHEIDGQIAHVSGRNPAGSSGNLTEAFNVGPDGGKDCVAGRPPEIRRTYSCRVPRNGLDW